MKRMKVMIDPGHGGKDPGAVNGSYKEAVYALEISKKLGEKLSKVADVLYIRTDNSTVELNDRPRIANAKGVDLYISIHLNASENKAAVGLETLVQNKNEGTAHMFAEVVQKKLIAATGAVNRGVKAQNLAVTRMTTMPSILVETGFISNEAECAKLITPEYQDVIATAIYKAYLEYFNIVEEKKEEEKKEEEEVKYNTIDEVPDWGKKTVNKLIEKGFLEGDGKGLDLSNDMLRILVINDRAGIYDK